MATLLNDASSLVFVAQENEQHGDRVLLKTTKQPCGLDIAGSLLNFPDENGGIRSRSSERGLTMNTKLQKSLLCPILLITLSVLLVTVCLTGCVTTPAPQTAAPAPSTEALNRAKAHYHKGEMALAVEEAKKAIELDPKNAQWAWLWLGLSYAAQGHVESARTAYNKALVSGSDREPQKWAYLYLGQTYREDFEKAIDFYDKALQLDATFPNPVIEKGDMYLSKGFYKKALNAYQKAQVGKNLTRENRVRVYRGEAFCCVGLGDKDKAFSMLKKAEEASPEYVSRDDIGLIYYAFGEEEQLKAHYARKGYLGTRAKNLDGQEVKGIEVIEVTENSPAEKGGLQVGDRIVQMNGIAPTSTSDFVKRLAGLKPGSSVNFKVMRGEEERDIAVILGSATQLMNTAWMEANPLITAFLKKRKMLEKADETARNGELRKAFQFYTAYLQLSEDLSSEYGVITRMIRVVSQLNPPPVIPEEAKRHAVRAQTYLQTAKMDQDYAKALDEFEEALLLAPWWADAYFNCALAQEAAEDFEGAIRSCNLFLVAAPNDPAAGKIQNKIYALEVQAEKMAPFKPWLGKWRSPSGSVLQMKAEGNSLRLVEVEPSPSALKTGWRAGDVVLFGAVSGLRMHGKCLMISDDVDVIRCFGRKFEMDAKAELSPDGKTITVWEQAANFQINTCKINYYYDMNPYQYTQIEE